MRGSSALLLPISHLEDNGTFRIRVDLKELPSEVTHNLWRDVEDGDGRLNVLVTVSGTTRGDAPSNLTNVEHELDKLEQQWVERYVSNYV